MMTDNSEREVAIARAKNTTIFQKWEKLTPGDELKYGGRKFIKGHMNVVVGTMLTDEDRLIERINQTYASSQKQYLLKKETQRKEKDELIRPGLSPDDTPQTAAAKSKPTFWKRWLPLKEGGMIEYNQRWFMKDKEGNGEKELLKEILKNNEKSLASRAKSDEDKKKEAVADILLSLTGVEAKAMAMAELPPSARGQNRDDFDDKKNAAEEGLKTDVEKNDDNDDNDDWGGTGDDGNDDEWGNVGVSKQWTEEATIAEKLATAPSLCLDSDTSEDENPSAIDAPANFKFSHAKKCPRRTLPLLTTEADTTGQVQNIMELIEAEGMSVKPMPGDGNCLFRSLSDQLYNDNGANHKIVRKKVCKHLSRNTESIREFFKDSVNISKYIEKMREDKVWGGNPEIAAAAKYFGRTITIFQDRYPNSRISIGDSIRNEPPLMVVYTGGNHYDSVIGHADFFHLPSSSDEDEWIDNDINNSVAISSSLRKYASDRLPIAKRTRSGPKEVVLTDAQNETVLTYPFHANENDLSAAASGLKELGGDLLGLDHDHSAALNSSIITTNERKTKQNRTHHLIFRRIDMENLLPGQCLSDVHIDFWMRW